MIKRAIAWRRWPRNRARFVAGVILLGAVGGGDVTAQESFLDRVGESLSASTSNGFLRARLSGTLDLEGYAFSRPPPALIHASDDTLFAPRLSLFVDAQMGDSVYAFGQMRVDRGFDPGPRALRGRLDEYAVRVTPWRDGRLSLQAGKFGTIVGNWVARHGSWDNPFVGAPLPYEHLTGVWDNAAPRSVAELQEWAHLNPPPPRGAPVTDKPLRLPILWGPSYTTGISVSGELGRLNYAAEIKDASLSSRPRVWNRQEFKWRHPTVSARLGYRPNAMWHWGVSASGGSFLRTDVRVGIPGGMSRGDYRQIVIAHDVAFAWHHLQVWAEVFGARFEIPRIGDADVLAYYMEVKYKFTPQLFGAVRWNEQLHFKMHNGAGRQVRWGANVRRLDVGPAYRFTPHTQLKLQYSLQHDEVSARAFSHLIAAQFVMRF